MNKLKDPAFVTFDYKGVRYAMRCQDPSNPPLPPASGKNLHLCIPEDRQMWYEPVSAEEGRQCFRQGWIEAGGDPAKLSAYFDLMTSRPHTSHAPIVLLPVKADEDSHAVSEIDDVPF